MTGIPSNRDSAGRPAALSLPVSETCAGSEVNTSLLKYGQEVYELNYKAGDDITRVAELFALSNRSGFLLALIRELAEGRIQSGSIARGEPEITGIQLIISNRYFTTIVYSTLCPGPDGSIVEGQYHVLRDSPLQENGAVVIPVTEDGRLIMIKEFRVPAGKAAWQFIRGGARSDQPDEALEDIVRREAAEEAGLICGAEAEIKRVGTVHPSNDLYAQTAAVAVLRGFSRDMTFSSAQSNETILGVAALSLTEVEGLIRSDQITDDYTLSAFLKARLAGLLC